MFEDGSKEVFIQILPKDAWIVIVYDTLSSFCKVFEDIPRIRSRVYCALWALGHSGVDAGLVVDSIQRDLAATLGTYCNNQSVCCHVLR